MMPKKILQTGPKMKRCRLQTAVLGILFVSAALPFSSAATAGGMSSSRFERGFGILTGSAIGYFLVHSLARITGHPSVIPSAAQ
jgi:AraC-like DNA-binding protein